MKERDGLATGALRSALAAIDNAEAVDVSLAPTTGSSALGVSGLGAGEVPRQHLDEAHMEDIVCREIGERLLAAEDYDSLGQLAESARLRAEAEVLQRQLRQDAAPSAAETS
jgi:hypothetical protein